MERQGEDNELAAKTYSFEEMAEKTGTKTKQILASCAVNLATLTAGCILGWTSPTLPRLDSEDSYIYVNPEQGSWIGSLAALGAAIGPIPAGVLADRIGRRWTMLGLAIPFVLSWGLIAGAHSVAMIYAARVIAGFALGAVFAVAPMYVGEISEDSIRGAMGSMLNAFITVGFLYEYVIGPYVSYLALALASLVIPVLFAIAFFFMPESPYYLLARGRNEEASKSLVWLRSASKDAVAPELEMMKESVEESAKNSGSIKDLFATRGNRIAMAISWGLVGFQQFSGINAILFYSTTIFDLSGSHISSDVSTIIVGVVMMFSAFCTPLLVERLGRRPLLFISATGMVIAQFVLGLYFFLMDVKKTDMSSVGWLPILCLVSYIAVYSIGYGPLPWAVVGEILPANIKGLGTASTASFCWLLGFLITKFFQNIVDALHPHVAFWGFAVFCLISNVFVYFLLPETKGKSLNEIQDLLNKKSSSTSLES